jgi:hypothetical protein
MEGYILLSILAFAFSSGALCATAAAYFSLRYNLTKIQHDIASDTNLKLQEQAEYLLQKSQEESFVMIRDAIQSNLDQGSSLSMGNFNNIGI